LLAGADQVAHTLTHPQEIASVFAGASSAEPVLTLGPPGAGLGRAPHPTAAHIQTGPIAAFDAFPPRGQTFAVTATCVEFTDQLPRTRLRWSPLQAPGLYLYASLQGVTRALALVGEAFVLTGWVSVTPVVLADSAVGAGHGARPPGAAGGVRFTAADERPEAARLPRLTGRDAGVGIWIRIGGGTLYTPAYADHGAVLTRLAVGGLQTDLLSVTVRACWTVEVIKAHQLAAIADPNFAFGAVGACGPSRAGLTPGVTTLTAGGLPPGARLAAAGRVGDGPVQDGDDRVSVGPPCGGHISVAESALAQIYAGFGHHRVITSDEAESDAQSQQRQSTILFLHLTPLPDTVLSRVGLRPPLVQFRF